MSKQILSFKNIFGFETQKEINILPQELIKKRRELEVIKKEINNINEKLIKVEQKLKRHNKEIIIEENNLSVLLVKNHSIKLRQKMITTSIKKEEFNTFIKNIMNEENKNIKEIIILFFNFKNEYKEEFKFILQNKDSLIELFNNSYLNIEILYNSNSNQFFEIKQNIINIISNNEYLIKNNLKYPFNLIIEYITNSFELISVKNKINEINEYINNKNVFKNKLFLNKIIYENNIQENEQKIKTLEKYLKNANNIIEKYKDIQNHENEKEILEMIKQLLQNSCSKKETKNEKEKKFIKNNNEYSDKQKERNERIKLKKIMSLNGSKLKEKIICVGDKNNNNNLSIFKKNICLKDLSFNQLEMNTNFKNYSPKVKLNSYISFSNKIKNTNSYKKKAIKLSPDRKKFLNGNGQIYLDKSVEKPKVNKILLPYNYIRYSSINKNSNKVGNIIMRKYNKSPTYEYNTNKSMYLLDDKTIKANRNKFINFNFEQRMSFNNSFMRKK